MHDRMTREQAKIYRDELKAKAVAAADSTGLYGPDDHIGRANFIIGYLLNECVHLKDKAEAAHVSD